VRGMARHGSALCGSVGRGSARMFLLLERFEKWV